MKAKASRQNAEAPKTYAGLVAMHVPRPIHDKAGIEDKPVRIARNDIALSD